MQKLFCKLVRSERLLKTMGSVPSLILGHWLLQDLRTPEMNFRHVIIIFCHVSGATYPLDSGLNYLSVFVALAVYLDK